MDGDKAEESEEERETSVRAAEDDEAAESNHVEGVVARPELVQSRMDYAKDYWRSLLTQGSSRTSSPSNTAQDLSIQHHPSPVPPGDENLYLAQ